MSSAVPPDPGAHRPPGFGRRLLDLLACPRDGARPLLLEEDEVRPVPAPAPRRGPACGEYCGWQRSPMSGLPEPPPCGECLSREVATGRLRCPACSAVFPIADGVVSFLPAAGGSPADRAAAPPNPSEREVRDAEATLYDSLFGDREYRHELATYRRLLDPRPDDRLLDLGCGTGRVTKEYAARVAETVAVDFSAASLRVLRARTDLGPTSLVWPVAADATRLPLRAEAFDQAVSLSVVCFLPGRAAQDAMLAELARVLVPRGTLVISTFHYAVVKRLWALAGRTEGALKRGTQSGGRVTYVNHIPAEFSTLLAPRFAAGPPQGICHRIPFLSRVHPDLAAGLDWLAARLPGGRTLFATEMVTRASRVPPGGIPRRDPGRDGETSRDSRLG